MGDFERKLASGAVAGVIGTTTIYPLDIIKTKLQSGQYSSIIECVRDISKTGFRSFYRGLKANLIGIMPEKAIKLAVNHQFRQFFGSKQNIDPERLSLGYGMFSGGMAGLCQVVATNPMEIVKIRVQLAGKGGPPLVQLVRQMGLRGLYKGTFATLARDVPFSVIFFSSHGYLKSLWTKEGDLPSLKVIFFSGMLAGSVSAVAVTPMDVVKTKYRFLTKIASQR